ncbi:MAG: gamma-glutamyl-gamma-aminobutyrate hydrolase family protein [Alicyclobacillus sp.]|nr:gamma-glutamyl-gamma-aminobutyrate hydrolase family protein [Alicyclobacillus sp.]
MRPLIGITGTRHVIPVAGTGPVLLGVVSADDYAQGVETAGGLPVVVPFLEDEQVVQALAERLDGLVLAGGEDVDPARFGEPPLAGLGTVVPERDALEMALIHALCAQGKPVLGLCRGIQVLNVAFGGSLYQDLGRQWRGHIQHAQKARRDHLSHEVRLAPHSLLAQLYGGQTRVRCNSFHHQAVRSVGPGLRAVAWDADGLIEGIEAADGRFVVGVQWHPENLWRRYPEHHGLFRGLVSAALQARQGASTE